MIEREKRWKLNGEIPSNKIKDKFTITQTYADSKHPSIRVRKISRENSEEYFHTVKYSLDNHEREEIEQKLSKERYERIFDSLDKRPVIKERTLVDISDRLIAEIDDFFDTGDKIIEVEFPTEDSMNSFSPPPWFGDEIKSKESFSYTVFTKLNNIKPSLWD